MPYTVGEMVRIREDLEPRKIYGCAVFVPGMLPYRGNIALIGRINGRAYTYRLMSISGYLYDWSWSDEMLEKVDLIEAVVRITDNSLWEKVNEQERILI